MGGYEKSVEIEEVKSDSLPLLSLNHVSLLVESVWDSSRFYQDVLGFVLVKRPASFNFRGAWLFNYGIGIHLLENESVSDYDIFNKSRPINPKDNHISFQCTDVEVVTRRLEELGTKYVTTVVEDQGIKVDQVFFHDPDGYMIEICNCDNLPLLPISSSSSSSFSSSSCSLKPEKFGSIYKNSSKMGGAAKCGLMEIAMMESLSLDMMNFAF